MPSVCLGVVSQATHFLHIIIIIIYTEQGVAYESNCHFSCNIYSEVNV